ncbi:MAG: AAA family ATPase, partial [Chloroflexi bacterium]|nr:AAA family ATPase [Chloroflexota bacterium]
DPSTYQVAKNWLTFEPLAPIRVKGKAEPVPVYRPEHEVAASARSRAVRTTIVGREAERTVLREELEALSAGGPGGVVVLEGEAGLGKSRLVSDIVQQADALGFSSFIGAGDAIERSTFYHAWRPVLSQLLDVDVIGDNERRRRHVLNLLDDDPNLLERAPLLNSVVALDIPDSDLTSQIAGEVRAQNTRDLLVELLQTTARGTPMLLVLDDAQWLDSASWQLALEVCRRVRPLLFVITTRPPADPLPAEYELLFGLPEIRHLRLRGLSIDDTIALVSQRLGATELPAEIAGIIREKAHGNPFVAEALAYALRDSGLIAVADGVCRIAPGAGDLRNLVPETVQGVIISRIDRLAPSQQLLLKVASVVGRTFPFRILRDVYPIAADREHLAEHLDRLQDFDVVPIESGGQELTFSFRHIMIQEAAYNLMLFTQRRQLHEAVGTWYEANCADELPPYYPLLAHHWTKAEVDDKAIHYLEKAAEQALQSYANQEAADFLTQLLALESRSAQPVTLARRARWERQLGEAHLGLGNIPQARSHLERAAAALGLPIPTTEWRLKAGLSRAVARQVIRRLNRSGGRGSQNQGDDASALEAARIHLGLGQIAFYTNDRTLNLYANLCALNFAELAGPTSELARSYASVGVASGLVPLHGPVELYGRLARQTAATVGQQSALAWVLLVGAVYDAGVGRWRRAERRLLEVREIAGRLGDRRLWEQACNTLAMTGYLRGDFAASIEYGDEVYASAHRRNDAQYQVYGRLAAARGMLARDDVGQLEPLLAEVSALLERNLGRAVETAAFALLAEVRLHNGDRYGAREAVDQAWAHVAQSNSTSYSLLPAYEGIARVYLSLWERSRSSTGDGDPELSALTTQACQSLTQLARIFPIARPAALWCRGRIDRLGGRTTHAERTLRAAANEAKRLRMPYAQARAELELSPRRVDVEPAKRRSPTVSPSPNGSHESTALSSASASSTTT